MTGRWEYINKKREAVTSKYYAKMLIALNKTAWPVLKELSKITSLDNLQVGQLIKEDIIKKAYIDLYVGVGKNFMRDWTDQFDSIKGLQEDIWEEEMTKYALETAGVEITLITNYTKELIEKAVKKVMQEGIEKGLSTGEMMKNLRTEITRGDYARFTKARALRIAKTEIMTASNIASIKAALGTGIPMFKVWLTAPFGIAKKERHNAIGMNGVMMPVDKPFSVNGEMMMAPGDSSMGASASNIINCNCSIYYKVL